MTSNEQPYINTESYSERLKQAYNNFNIKLQERSKELESTQNTPSTQTKPIPYKDTRNETLRNSTYEI